MSSAVGLKDEPSRRTTENSFIKKFTILLFINFTKFFIIQQFESVSEPYSLKLLYILHNGL